MSAEQRAHPRELVERRGVLVHAPSGRSYRCLIVDVSCGGARLIVEAEDLPRQDLSLLDGGSVHQLRIAWRDGALLGVAFTDSVEMGG